MEIFNSSKGLVVDVALVDGPITQVETVKALIVETVTRLPVIICGDPSHRVEKGYREQ